MSTSKPAGDKVRLAPIRLALEALVLGAALALLPELAGAVLDPHPGWLAVLVLAARYGGFGLTAGLLAAAGGVGGAALITGASPITSWSHLQSGANLLALFAALSLGWIGSWHRRRQAQLSERVRVLSDRAAEDRAVIGALFETTASLRERLDHASTSLSFLREVATRLEGLDPVAAADGAVDLALVRTGASAAEIRVGMNGAQRPLATRDARGSGSLVPLSMDDAEMTVPIHAGRVQVGVLVLWGIPASASARATLHDLKVIASWCSRALTSALEHRVESLGRTRWVE